MKSKRSASCIRAALLLAGLLFIGSESLHAQLRTEWVRQFTGGGLPERGFEAQDGVQAVKTDQNGNICALVSYSHTLQVGGTSFTNELTNEEAKFYNGSVFVRMASDGTVLATRRFESPLLAEPVDLEISRNGHIYAAIYSQRESAPGLRKVTLFRLSETGETVWEVTLPFSHISMAAADDGRLLVAVSLWARLGEDDIHVPTIYSIDRFSFTIVSKDQIALVKIGADGAVLDAQLLANPESNSFTSGGLLTFSRDGNFFLGGAYGRGELLLGNSNLPTPPIVDSRSVGRFIALVSWDSGIYWARHLFGLRSDGVGLSTPRPGIAYHSATFSESYEIDDYAFSAPGESAQLTLSRWDDSGKLLGASHVSGLGPVSPFHSLVVGNTGDFYFYYDEQAERTLPGGKLLSKGKWLIGADDEGEILNTLKYSIASRLHAIDPGGDLIMGARVSGPIDLAGALLQRRGRNANTTATIIKLGPGNLGPPYILTQPQAPITLRTENATLMVDARGSAPLAYQWQKDGIDLPGETGASLTTPFLGTTDQGEYRVVISNAQGTITSASAGVYFAPPRADVSIAWALQYDYSDKEEIVAVESDALGNVYFAGRMDDIMLMGDETVSGFVFVGKADSSGNLLWRFGDGTESPFAGDKLTVNSLAIGEEGGVYICGNAQGNGQIGHQGFSAQWIDAFLARLNPDGTLDWAQVIGGDGIDEATDVSPAPGGGVLVAGKFSSVSALLPAKVGGNDGTFDTFVARIDSDGSIDWAKGYGGSGSESAFGIQAEGKGQTALLAAQYSLPFTLGGTALADPRGIGNHFFLAELNLANGDVINASPLKGFVRDLEVNPGTGGGTFLCGNVIETMTYQGQTLTDVSDGTTKTDGFLALTGNTEFNWLNQIAAPGNAGVTALGANHRGSIYASGFFTGSQATFAPDATGTSPNVAAKRFVAKYDAAGGLRWFTALEGSSLFPTAMAAGPGDSVYVGGSFTGYITLGGRVLQNFELSDAPPKNKADAVLYKVVGAEAPPIHFTRHPENRSLPVGEETRLTAEISDAVLSWQWFEGERGDTTKPVGRATANTFAPVQTSGIHRFWVRAELADGTFLSSATATLQFIPPPAFTEHPERAFVALNAAATLTAQATGSGLVYQWFRGAAGDVSTPQPFGARTRYATPPIAATESFWVRATDYLGQTADSLAAIIAPLGGSSDYDSWKTSLANGFTEAERNSASFDTDDPDGDGLGNLLEYALGFHPKSPNGSALSFVQVPAQADYVTFSFPRARSDVTYIIEISQDGQAWTDFATNPGSVGETVEVRSALGPEGMLVRLRAEWRSISLSTSANFR